MAETIWIVDDDFIYSLLIKKDIERLQLSKNIHQFQDGEKAMQTIENHLAASQPLPDIILLDINMPVMDGWQFLDNYIHKKYHLHLHSHVYLVSSSISIQDKQKALGYKNIKGHLIKPISQDTLVTITGSFR
ncbi:response regulator [Limnovirga soli]|jgi:CheY-like chemotaxis protein|uniref:Response regulator n=1 Tax=Limnovirga soli TaxID=2656915 RepID=A0A8J8JVH9_9BACT|nr:response regulator [Limnovirga soli]NNV56644.1 response regulator [Limnovirga soli]